MRVEAKEIETCLLCQNAGQTSEAISLAFMCAVAVHFVPYP